jgi:hypothetical protein
MQIELPPALPKKELDKSLRKQTTDEYFGFKNSSSSRKVDEKSIKLIHDFSARLFQEGRYEDSLHLSLLIIESSSTYVDAYYNASLALFHLQKYAEAKAMLARAPECMWKLSNPNYNMACIEVALGNFSSAIIFANTAAKIDASLSEVMQNDSDLWPIRDKIK